MNDPFAGSIAAPPMQDPFNSPPVSGVPLAPLKPRSHPPVYNTAFPPPTARSPHVSPSVNNAVSMTNSNNFANESFPVTRSPVVDAPIPNGPANDDPFLSADLPDKPIPSFESNMMQVPVEEVPVASDVPFTQAPVGDYSVMQVPVEEVPVASDVPFTQAPVGDYSVMQVPVEEVPVADEAMVAPVNDTPPDSTPNMMTNESFAEEDVSPAPLVQPTLTAPRVFTPQRNYARPVSQKLPSFAEDEQAPLPSQHESFVSALPAPSKPYVSAPPVEARLNVHSGRKMDIYVAKKEYQAVLLRVAEVQGIIHFATDHLARVLDNENVISAEVDNWHDLLNSIQENLIAIDMRLFEKGDGS